MVARNSANNNKRVIMRRQQVACAVEPAHDPTLPPPRTGAPVRYGRDGRKLPPHTFQPGQSGNPNGRPKNVGDVRRIARTYSEDALKTLAEIMQDKDIAPPARVAAAQCLLDRGYGKPTQQVELSVSSAFDELSDEDLDEYIARQAAIIAVTQSVKTKKENKE